MSYHQISLRHVAAVEKSHACAWCGETIEAGQPCVYRRYKLDGSLWNERMHPECHAALKECVRESDGTYYFMSGDHARGCTDDDRSVSPMFGADGRRVEEGVGA